MSDQEDIVAVALLTRRDVDALGATLKKLFLVDRKLMFLELLQALDEAEGRDIQAQ